MNILFLTVSAGGGHSKTAEVIKDYIELNYKGSKSQIVDVYRYVSPIIDKLVIGSYLRSLKINPKLWGKIYELSEKDDNTGEIMQKINKLLSYKIKKYIRTFKPDVIVCTHPFPLQMVNEMKKKNIFDTPIVTVITDYAVHSFWIQEQVNAYIIPHESMIYDMLGHGVRKEKIYPLGLPVSPKFLEQKNKIQLQKNFGLENIPTFLIMGGSLGIGKIKKIFISLLASTLPFQIIIICGNNDGLKRELEKTYHKLGTHKNALILGFTNKVDELMAISDWIITKPGGLTVTEAIIMKLPIIIMSPIPGQEEKNSTFLLNNGIGIELAGSENIEKIYHQFLDNKLRIKHMKEMCEYVSKPNATKDIADFLHNIERIK